MLEFKAHLVDFVVNGEIAIEVKTTRNVSGNDLKGLRFISDEGSFAKRLLVCNEPVEREVDGIAILPWENGARRNFRREIFVALAEFLLYFHT